MPAIPDDFLKELNVSEREVIRSALTANTAEANRAQIASQIYLAHQTRAGAERLATTVESLAGELARAFADHAKALQVAAHSSERYARGLNLATWALVGATIVLAFLTAVQVWKG